MGPTALLASLHLLLYLPLGPHRCLSIASQRSLRHLSALRLRTNAGRSRDEKVPEAGIGVLVVFLDVFMFVMSETLLTLLPTG